MERIFTLKMNQFGAWRDSLVVSRTICCIRKYESQSSNPGPTRENRHCWTRLELWIWGTETGRSQRLASIPLELAVQWEILSQGRRWRSIFLGRHLASSSDITRTHTHTVHMYTHWDRHQCIHKHNNTHMCMRTHTHRVSCYSVWGITVKRPRHSTRVDDKDDKQQAPATGATDRKVECLKTFLYIRTFPHILNFR